MAKAKPKPKRKDDTEPADLFVEPLLLEKLLRWDAEVRCARVQVALLELQQAEQRRAHQEQIKKAQSVVMAAARSFDQAVVEVEAKYEINMREFGYDPETGRLTRHE